MIKIMCTAYNVPGRELFVTDLSHAVQTMSSEEVTKEFFHAASYMLSVALGGKGKVKKAATAKAASRKGQDPLWDTKQLGIDQWFS